MTITEMKALPAPERMAGYLLCSAKLAALGARLRKNNRADDTWTDEEDAEWDAISDEMDYWFYALSDEERTLLDPIETFFSSLTRGEVPGS